MPKIVGNVSGPGGHVREYNVKAYGAKGDGTTNDTAAIQAAIQAAWDGGGGEVWFPPGTFLMSTNGGIQFPTPTSSTSYRMVRLKGSGAQGGGTTIKFTGTGFAFTIGSADPVWDARYCYIEDMSIVGTGSSNPSGAVKFNHSRLCELKRLNIQDFTGNINNAAIDILGGAGLHNYFHMIEHCRIVSTPIGIRMSSDNATGVGANSNWVKNCVFGSHATYAILIDGGDTNVIEQCEFNGTISTAIYIVNTATNTKLLCDHFDGPSVKCVVASAGVTDTYIIAASGSGTITNSGTNTHIWP